MITWKPYFVSTGSLTLPTGSANAASENGLAILSRVNFPTLPARSLADGSSEYSLASAVKSAPDFAFASTSSARFRASALERTTVLGAPSAPLYATSTCCAATLTGAAPSADGVAAVGVATEGALPLLLLAGDTVAAAAVGAEALGDDVGFGGESHPANTNTTPAHHFDVRITAWCHPRVRTAPTPDCGVGTARIRLRSSRPRGAPRSARR